MKKIAIATLITLSAAAASAIEVGVTTTRDYAGSDRDTVGITLGQSYDKVNVTAGFDRATKGTNNQDRYALVGGYDLVKFGNATMTVKAGGAYLDNQHGEDGYALTVGAGIILPVTNNVAATIDYAHQYGQSRVDAFDGNRITIGVKYAF
jgi:opacity protein-like surface antigen